MNQLGTKSGPVDGGNVQRNGERRAAVLSAITGFYDRCKHRLDFRAPSGGDVGVSLVRAVASS